MCTASPSVSADSRRATASGSATLHSPVPQPYLTTPAIVRRQRSWKWRWDIAVSGWWREYTHRSIHSGQSLVLERTNRQAIRSAALLELLQLREQRLVERVVGLGDGLGEELVLGAEVVDDARRR